MLHFPNEYPPILDSSIKETTIDDIETCFGILESKVDIVELWSIAGEIAYLKGQVVGLVRHHGWRQIDDNELRSRKDLSDLLGPDTTSTTDIQYACWVDNWHTNTTLPEVTHSPVNCI
jgi:hypothetical protein